ncbi:MAG: hypothetical protein ACLVJ6_08920 [Merdibacter sp.]
MIEQRRIDLFLKGQLDRMHALLDLFDVTAGRDAVLIQDAKPL